MGRTNLNLPVRLYPCLLLLLCGCTTLSDYVHNGFKVGPNYAAPPAPLANDWLEATDKRKDGDDLSEWWKGFNDPVLNDLIVSSYKQNLTLQQAGYRIMQARAQLGIAVGELFPQSQAAQASYQRSKISDRTVDSSFETVTHYSQFNVGFALAWEIDFWGRFRRSVE